jgi:hypothetical protein
LPHRTADGTPAVHTRNTNRKSPIWRSISKQPETSMPARLYAQVVVDKAALARNIRQALQERSQITLKEISERHPLAHGLAELVAYLQLGSDQLQGGYRRSDAGGDQLGERSRRAACHHPPGALAPRYFCEMNRMSEDPTTPLAEAGNELSILVISLLKGVLYQESDAGPVEVADPVASPRARLLQPCLALELVLDEAEGYAFLRARPETDDECARLPRLIARRPLSFPVSLLLALLRKKWRNSMPAAKPPG